MFRKSADQRGHLHCQEAFSSIEQQREHSQSRRFARDIGCSDIAATTAPDVLPANDANQQIAEWDRTQQITQRGCREHLRHIFQIRRATATPLREIEPR